MSAKAVRLGILSAAAWLAVLSAPSHGADPAPPLPAKTHHQFMGYTGQSWARDYGVIRGRCDRVALGAALESAGGKDNVRPVTPVVGPVGGGHEPDAADLGCLGHALELSRDGQKVSWTNPETGATYRVTAGRGFAREDLPCRSFIAHIGGKGGSDTRHGKACRRDEGVWELVQDAPPALAAR